MDLLLKKNTQKQHNLLNNEFKVSTETLSQLGQQNGYHIAPYVNSQLPFFSPLDYETKCEILSQLSFFIEVCTEVLNSGQPLSNSKALTWKALKKFHLIPCSDLFDKIKDENIIEIYNHKNIQIFRNFPFFNICSYTLEELYCKTWMELFQRDPSITHLILSYGQKIYSQKVNSTLPVDVPIHTIEELSSRENLRFKYSMDYLSPLKKQNLGTMAVLAIESAHIIKPLPTQPSH